MLPDLLHRFAEQVCCHSRGLHDEIEDAARAGADGVARVCRQWASKCNPPDEPRNMTKDA